MGTITGFPPIADSKAVVLILGSMPSTRSLADQQYYAHPRNDFWHIMISLLSGGNGAGYEQRKDLLLQNRIALWDVLNTCQRRGSLDSSIKNETVVVNDFGSFYSKHPQIKSVFFNGARAQQEYNKRVLPTLDQKFRGINYARLPSTSPAMASLSREQKLQAWRVVLEALE